MIELFDTHSHFDVAEFDSDRDAALGRARDAGVMHQVVPAIGVAGFAQARAEPESAFFHQGLGEFLLPYEAVRTADDPQRALLRFLETTYEAAATLGAGPWTTFRRVLLPALVPALVTGGAQAFARALGEFGSVVLISGNLPYRTEVASWWIFTEPSRASCDATTRHWFSFSSSAKNFCS